ncbi:zinc finger and BTB domain-containing protein 14-like [Ruditapes philippinarum]|uniref:zinc finger and BTB domain-containing protein 14-like n=1 Tax=Ruditapes philippinarum TaxID=129788 RepID=UPI00295AFB64|nr:zinc finger and BTB domain-containing protein 14-like [Ruditapes philippinarum]
MQDLEVFKQIPGYKAILKAVLKNQIQSLVNQLAQQTGEESVLITASLEEGTLTQLGSEFGKTFLEGHDEIKSQFLGFCLKRNQIQKQTKEFQESKPRKSWSARRPNTTRSEPYPVSLTTSISRSGSQKAEHGRRKPSKTIKTEIKTEPTFQYITPGTEDYDAMFTSYPTSNLDPLTSEGQSDSEHPENHSQSQVAVKTDVVNKQVHVDNLMVTKDGSVESLYTENSVDSISQVDNHSPDGVYEGTDSSDMGADEAANVCDEIVAGQKNEPDMDTEHFSGEDQMRAGHFQNGGIDTADMITDLGSSKIHDVTPLKETKPKLKLFSRNRKSNMQKSLKERKAELENYLNLENTDRPYPCNLCPKRFKERHHLVYHLRTHSGHRPYVCSICNKGFTQSSSLNTHKKLHLKDMSCEFCGLVFRKISLLQNHVCRALTDLNNTI